MLAALAVLCLKCPHGNGHRHAIVPAIASTMNTKLLCSHLAALIALLIAPLTWADSKDESRAAADASVDSLAGKKTVFLGDSITQAGEYVTFASYYLALVITA